MHCSLPSNSEDTFQVKCKSQGFFVEDNHLFYRDFNQASLKCLVGLKSLRYTLWTMTNSREEPNSISNYCIMASLANNRVDVL